MPAGTQVIVNTAAANRLPAVYDDPDSLDITRRGPACLRSAAAFTTASERTSPDSNSPRPLTVITRRMPNPHRRGPAPWKAITGITGPTTLPIEFDAAH